MMSLIKKRKQSIIVFIIFFFSLLLRIQNIWFPIGADLHSFRQTETAIVIQNYFNDGFSLFQYEMPVLGQPWKILFEFPIYQSIVYLVMKILHKTDIDVWCRLISLCSFYLSAYALRKVAGLFADKKSVNCICIVYLFAPFTILWSRAALIDYMSVLFALVYVWGVYLWLIEEKRTFLVALVFGCLAYLLKATTMFPYVFFLAYLIVDYFWKQIHNQYGRISLSVIFEYIVENKMHLIALSVLCILPIIPGICWTRYADSIKNQSIYTRSLTTPFLHSWNYGTMEQKLSISNWKIILRRLIDYMGGKTVVVCLAVVYLFTKKKENLSLLINCGIAIILTIFLLFNLFYVHDYYMIALTPLLSIAYGVVLSAVGRELYSIKHAGKLVSCIALVLIVYAQVRTNSYYLKYAIKMSAEEGNAGWFIESGNYIGSITDENERIVIEGEDWNPAILYYANRKGMMVSSPQNIDSSFFTEFLQEEKYTTLLTHSIYFADTLAQHYNVLVQCPRYEGIYVYKFYQESSEISFYQNSADNIIKVIYDNVTEPVEIGVVFVDKNGKEVRNTINLLANKNVIYYNVGDICPNVQMVHFDTPEGVEVVAEFE